MKFSFDRQKAQALAVRAPSGVDIYSRRKFTLAAALDKIEELEKDLVQSERIIRAKMDTIGRLEAEGKRAIEHIDDLNVIIANQKEKLLQLQAFRENVVKALDYNPITAHLRADKDLLQEISELEKKNAGLQERCGRISDERDELRQNYCMLAIGVGCKSKLEGLECARCGSKGPFKPLFSENNKPSKPAPREGCIQYRIRERQITLRAEAHQYMMNGPAEQKFSIHTADDMAQAIKALLMAANRGKPLQVSIQEA